MRKKTGGVLKPISDGRESFREQILNGRGIKQYDLVNVTYQNCEGQRTVRGIIEFPFNLLSGPPVVYTRWQYKNGSLTLSPKGVVRINWSTFRQIDFIRRYERIAT